jgi:superoxide dismutase, Cu-Zn family
VRIATCLRLLALLPLAIAGLAGCVSAASHVGDERRDVVTTTLRDAGGAERGRAALYQQGQQIRIEVVFTGAPGAVHGVHLHQVGTCTAPDFASAGEHWNPYRTPHGLAHPQGGHAGDLPNLRVGPDGSGRIDAQIDAIALTEARPLLVNMGAIIVHAAPDDMRTDPDGNSGARIACGAFGGG